MKLKQLLCASCILLGLTTVANDFADLTPSHWADNDAQKMANDGVVSGYSDGSFKSEIKAELKGDMAIAVKNEIMNENKLISEVPTMSARATWYKGKTDKNILTKVTFMDTYKPNGNEIESWNADINDDGNIKCYVVGTELIIAGNGSGKISANEDSSAMFWMSGSIENNLIEIVGLEILDVSKVTNMYAMFGNCSKIKFLDISNWNVSKVTNMRAMFFCCSDLEEIDVSNWDTNNIAKMNEMFQGCNSLKILSIGDKFVCKENLSLPRGIKIIRK